MALPIFDEIFVKFGCESDETLFYKGAVTISKVITLKPVDSVGTPIKFCPLEGIDSIDKNGITQTINVKFNCITMMDKYGCGCRESIEELRFEDYQVGRINPRKVPVKTSCATVPSAGVSFGEGRAVTSTCSTSTPGFTFSTGSKVASGSLFTFGAGKVTSSCNTNTSSIVFGADDLKRFSRKTKRAVWRSKKTPEVIPELKTSATLGRSTCLPDIAGLSPSPQDGESRAGLSPSPQDGESRAGLSPSPQDGESRAGLSPSPQDGELRAGLSPSPQDGESRAGLSPSPQDGGSRAGLSPSPQDGESRAGLSLSPQDGGESRASAEKQEVLDALFETQLKCLQIQNALQKLLLLRLKNYLPRNSPNYTKNPVNGAFKNSTIPIKGLAPSSVFENAGSEESETSCTTMELIDGISQPLEALLSCSGIQIALQNRISSLSTISCGDPRKYMDNGTTSKTVELSEAERQSVICSQLDTIFWNRSFECEYKQNPFSHKRQSPANSESTVHEIGQLWTGRVPHGKGKLSTLTGQVIYEGDWHKGKRHGTGEALMVSHQSTSTDDSCGYYEGEWENNMRHGHGSMLFPSGAKYDGQWHYDKMSGCGVMRRHDGAIIDGTWREGLLDGCALFTWPDGVTEYRQYEGGNVRHSRPVDKDVAADISRRNEQSMQVQSLSARLQELKLEQGNVTDMINNLRSTLRTELKNLEEVFNKINEDCSRKIAAALHEQEKEHEEKLKSSAAKLKEGEAKIVQLEMEVKQAIKESRLCQICFDRRRDCIIMPCTHLLYCRQCLAEHKIGGKNNCPARRGPINGELNCNLDF